MPEQIVLVLEDSEERLIWLRRVIAPLGVTLSVAADVTSFLKLCEAYDPRRFHADSKVVAIILDHDLGSPEDKLDGSDAVEKIPLIDAPVLVWTSNDVEGRKMNYRLNERGFERTRRIPFHADLSLITRTLTSWIRGTAWRG